MHTFGSKGDEGSNKVARCSLLFATIFLVQQLAAQTLINVDFGAGPAKSAKVGPAAIGQTAHDFWNYYSRDDGQGGWLTFGAVSDLSQADGTATSAGITV